MVNNGSGLITELFCVYLHLLCIFDEKSIEVQSCSIMYDQNM